MGLICKIVSFLSILISLNYCINGLDNGLALTPPMGWLAWERYRCITDCKSRPNECISERLFRNVARKMVEKGFLAAGYKYINIDDCWAAKERDKNFSLQADPVRFPNGIAALASYVHSLGLKLGIYGDFGTYTCGGYPGSKYFLERDANTFARWGVDSLKLDGCYTNTEDMKDGYPLMAQFLNKTGRPILFSCSWPAYISGHKVPPYAKIAESCNTWRNYGDIQDSWSSVKSIINFYAKDEGHFSTFAGPGHFNDPDMLILGDYGLSYDQERSQLALWSIMAAPLFISTDLDQLKQDTMDLLLNPRVIAINQDMLGKQGKRVLKLGNIDVWVRPIRPSGSFAIAILNQGEGGAPSLVSVKLSELNISSRLTFTLTDVFTGTVLGNYGAGDKLTFSVNPSGVTFFTAVPKQTDILV